MKSIPVIILSTVAVKNLFEKKFKTVLHEDCNWISITSAQLTKKKILLLLKQYDNRVQHLILLIPESNPLFHLIPCVLHNTVISFVTYKKPAELESWFFSVQNMQSREDRAIIASMQKPFYIKWAKRFYTGLKKPNKRVIYRPPELATKKDIGGSFAEGFRFCIYTGHGRNRGWSGYRGFRWEDIEAEKIYKTSGAVLSLSCSAFKPERNKVPFAMQWVNSGRLNAFCGFNTHVHIQPLIAISNYILEFISKHKKATVSSLVLYLHHQIMAAGNDAVVKEWKSFRIAGNPFVKIF